MPLDLPVTLWAEEIRRGLEAASNAQTAWAPPMDVLEGPSCLEIRLDVPGVPIDRLRVTVRGGTLQVTGDKPHQCRAGALFHVAERGCGHFVRTIPLRLAFDASGVRATLEHGELRIIVPRIQERRGHEIVIPVVAS
jgi:HSP20 family protein